MNDRRVLAALVAIGMLVCSFPIGISMTTYDSDASDIQGVLIVEVNPKGDAEGVTLKNFGSTSVNLKGWVISDHPTMTNEGHLEIIGNLTLTSGSTVTIVTSNNSDPFIQERSYIVANSSGSNGVKKVDSFTLANGGDDVYLFNNSGSIVDALCYGNVTISDMSLWKGDPIKLRGEYPSKRTSPSDSDSALDWKHMVDGWTENYFDSTIRYDAIVTPFLFPDHGGVPIYNALEEATDTVYINMYLFKAENVYALLIELEQRGVDVYVLADAGNLNWPGEADDLGCMGELEEAGGEVRLLNYGSSGRFAFDHAKYCIIDGTTTIVTSENWTGANLNGEVLQNPYVSNKGNRGWGAVIESTEYAGFMKTVFDNDYAKEYGDVCEYEDYIRGKTVNNKTLSYRSPTYTGVFASYNCQVAPMLSPDNSINTETYFIENATNRVYTQQQSTNADFAEYDEDALSLVLKGPMQSLKDAADRDIDVRYIVNSDTDVLTGDRSLCQLINSSTNIKAAKMTTPNVHNKGLICDDVSIVNSVNWTGNSFINNREAGVVIYSKAIADYFAESFITDFERNYEFDGPRATFTEFPNNVVSGSDITFTVEVTPDNREYTYLWDFGDGSPKRTTEIPRVSTIASEGTHTVTVTISDVSNPTYKCTISKQYSTGTENTFDLTFITEHIEYLIPILVVILGIIIKVIRR